MKKIFLIPVSLLVSHFLYGQAIIQKADTTVKTAKAVEYKKEEVIVKVEETVESFSEGSVPSLKTTIYVDSKKVANEWGDFIKKYGKVTSPKGMKNVFNMEAAKIATISYIPCQLSSKVINAGNGATTIVYAIKLDTGYVTKPKHPSFQTTKDLLHDFGVKMYRDDINDQIQDAEKAFKKLENQYDKLVRIGEGLAKDVESNKKEKITLDQKIADNKADSTRFITEIPNRLKEKDLAISSFNSKQTEFDNLKLKQISGGATADEVKKADKALSTAKKEKEKKANASDRAIKDSENNKEDKVTLYKKLQANAIELPKLQSQIVQNKKDQEVAKEQVAKQKVVVEVIREKLGTIR